MAWTTVNNRVLSDSDFSNNVIRELLHIKHNFANMTLYSKEEIDLYWSIVVQVRFCYLFFLCLCTMYEVHNK